MPVLSLLTSNAGRNSDPAHAAGLSRLSLVRLAGCAAHPLVEARPVPAVHNPLPGCGRVLRCRLSPAAHRSGRKSSGPCTSQLPGDWPGPSGDCTAGRLGERYCCWGRRTRNRPATGCRAGQSLRRNQRCLPGRRCSSDPAACCSRCLFSHRWPSGHWFIASTIGNPARITEYPSLRLESVSFASKTARRRPAGLLPEPNSDSTVVICHVPAPISIISWNSCCCFATRATTASSSTSAATRASQGHTSTFGLDEDADVKEAVDLAPKKNRPYQSRRCRRPGLVDWRRHGPRPRCRQRPSYRGCHPRQLLRLRPWAGPRAPRQNPLAGPAPGN